MKNKENMGDFTLPGEAGYEDLTLRLAKKWGADVIRDSDGTALSKDILNAGYGIYSTICLIRADNEWAKRNTDKLQQNFLVSQPIMALENTVEIPLLKGYSKEQFCINQTSESIAYWQVFDRTEGKEIPHTEWEYQPQTGSVLMKNAVPYHLYTANFLAVRLWEEISMYNHITNNWGEKEHLMAVEPRYPQVREHLLQWLDEWCAEHPKTNVVRLTSLFYNFTWIWSDNPRRRDDFSDWGSYDFTVNPIALREFEKEYGYAMTSEDFINQGKHNATHNAPSARYLDWVQFTNRFVTELGKACVDVIHKHGKQAYVFYDDSWVGMEPYSREFATMGMDGIIKCVFNAFEARLCAGVEGVKTHEIRLHPYLFPTGLGGLPTFAEGGNPTRDAKEYWMRVRRGILRKPIDRIGLGGYLSLTEPYPDFQDYIAELAEEFRLIKSLHQDDAPYTEQIRVAVLTAWGKLRSWTCSGHMHEHPDVDLIHVIEALAGLPVEVTFLSLQEVLSNGIPADVQVLINAGTEGSAWSGGDIWRESALTEKIAAFVQAGGGIIGVNEPSAVRGGYSFFRLAHLFGVDADDGGRICSGRFQFQIEKDDVLSTYRPQDFPAKGNLLLTEDSTWVLAAENGVPTITVHPFGKGTAFYLSGFRYSPYSKEMLMQMLCKATQTKPKCFAKDCRVDVAYYPAHDVLLAVNASENSIQTTVTWDNQTTAIELSPFEMKEVKRR